MMRLLSYASIFAVSASVVVAQDLESWNAERAEAFSSVCLASAPSFADVGLNAGKLGFRSAPEGLLLDPEVVVSLQQTDGDCSCYMTMGAPDQNALVMRVFQEMVADFGNDFRPDARQLVNDVNFERDGQTVRVTLNPSEIDGNPWITGRVTRAGSCS